MRINTKCSLAMHILLLLAIYSDRRKMTSELIAQSTGSNPVMVRNLLGSLKRAGIVQVQRGCGGASLALKPEEITLWQVYVAVDPDSFESLIGLHPNPSAKCPVGGCIYDLLEEPYRAVRQAMQAEMSRQTLAMMLVHYTEQAAPEKTQED